MSARKNQRAGYDRILIVSEGSKTEPNYFEEIRKEYRLRTANVQVRPGELGTDPIQVVQYAHDLFINGDPDKHIPKRGFEQIYAVFDRDQHRGYFNALKKAESYDGKLRNDFKQAVKFKAIPSVPSFELWLLLHYEDIQAPLHRDEVMQRLKRYIQGYEKGAGNAFSLTREHLNIALQRAERLAERFNAYDGEESYTAIFELVKLLSMLDV